MKLPITFILLASLFSCGENNRRNTIENYIATHNAHEVSKALTFYHPDIEFELENVWVKNGLEEVKKLELWDSTLNSHLELKEVEIKGDSVFCKVVENNDWFRGVGIEDLIHDPTLFVLENEKIKKILALPSPKAGKQIEEAMGSIMQWSTTNQDSTIYSLLPEGQFIYSEKSASTWLDLIGRWKSGQ